MIRIRLNQVWLVFISLLIVVFGLSIAFLSVQNAIGLKCVVGERSYANGVEMPNHKEGFDCECVDGGVSCEVSSDESLATEDFTLKHLSFNTEFYTDFVGEDVKGAPLNTTFDAVKSENSQIVATLSQAQLCTENDQPPTQLGMYNFDGIRLTLYSSINTQAPQYTEECTVQVTYQISNFDLKGNSLELFYQNESGKSIAADICIYSGTVYSEGDAYKAEDNCNVCECSSGVSKCTNDRVCSDEVKKSASVYWNFPDYSRYEEPETDGECEVDAHCLVRGCNNEVCTAEPETITSCEAVQIVAGAVCACKSNKCVWSK